MNPDRKNANESPMATTIGGQSAIVPLTSQTPDTWGGKPRLEVGM
jgi:hypothetical protein